MRLLVRRNLVSWASEVPEVELAAKARARVQGQLGRPWLDEIPVTVSSKGVKAKNEKTVTPPGFCDYWGSLGPKSGRIAVLRRESLESMWGDPWADYLLDVHPDAFLGSSGGMWLRPDVWTEGASSHLVSAEWLNTTAITWSPTEEQIAIISNPPEKWGQGSVVVGVIDVDGAKTRRHGGWQGSTDILTWAPSSDALFLSLRDETTNQEGLVVLDLVAQEIIPLAYPHYPQGLAFSPDGLSLAITHGGDEPGVSILGSREAEFAVGQPCWTPEWIDSDRLVIGVGQGEPDAPDGPGDELRCLDLRDGSLSDLLAPQSAGDGFHTAMRLCGATSPDVHEAEWWRELCDSQESIPARRCDDLQSLSEAHREQWGPEAVCLTYGDPDLFEQHSFGSG